MYIKYTLTSEFSQNGFFLFVLFRSEWVQCLHHITTQHFSWWDCRCFSNVPVRRHKNDFSDCDPPGGGGSTPVSACPVWWSSLLLELPGWSTTFLQVRKKLCHHMCSHQSYCFLTQFVCWSLRGVFLQKQTNHRYFFHLACLMYHGVTTEIHPKTSSSKPRQMYFEYFPV